MQENKLAHTTIST